MNPSHSLAPIVSIAILLSVFTATSAKAEVWQVNRSTSGGVTVVGTIETDGTTGALSADQFLNWNLVLTDQINGRTATLNGTNSKIVIAGSAPVSVTANQLVVNLNNDGDIFGFTTGTLLPLPKRFCSPLPTGWGFCKDSSLFADGENINIDNHGTGSLEYKATFLPAR